MNNPSQNLIPPDGPTGAGQADTTEVDDDAELRVRTARLLLLGRAGNHRSRRKGPIADGATVECCDLCRQYSSDAEALVRLQELGIA